MRTDEYGRRRLIPGISLYPYLPCWVLRQSHSAWSSLTAHDQLANKPQSSLCLPLCSSWLTLGHTLGDALWVNTCFICLKAWVSPSALKKMGRSSLQLNHRVLSESVNVACSVAQGRGDLSKIKQSLACDFPSLPPCAPFKTLNPSHTCPVWQSPVTP